MERIIPLNKTQIALVEGNISVIDTVIFSRIIFDNSSYGLEYDDLFQEGALLLCRAALKYDESKNCQFKTFAYVVVFNGLASYCRKICNKKKRQLSYIEKIEKNTCTPMFIAALFIIAITWKQPRCPSADEWIRKLWYIYTMEYYLTN